VISRTFGTPVLIAAIVTPVAAIEALPCDLLFTPHPDASRLWERVAARDAGGTYALVDAGACRAYAATARDRLKRHIASETGT
jgi:metallo-beta-lactamase class B